MTQRAPRTALEKTEEAYQVRFGEYAPVWGFMAHPKLADVLQTAVKRGEKLTANTLRKQLNAP